MNKLAFSLSLLLLCSAFLSGCGQTGGEPSQPQTPASSSAQSSSQPSASASPAPVKLPTKRTEVIAYNDKIDPETIRLIQLEAPAPDAVTVVIGTSLGEIKAVLYPQEAPLAVENFLALAREGFYNGKSFYQAAPGERIFGRASDEEGYEGKSAGGEPFGDEYSLNLWHFDGALCMNNQMLKNNNDSRFYIVSTGAPIPEELAGRMADAAFPQKVIDRYLEVGGLPGADHRDTVFGQVVSGMEVVQSIMQAGDAVKIESVTVLGGAEDNASSAEDAAGAAE